MAEVYAIGQAVRIHNTDDPFRNWAGVPTNPTAATLHVEDPSGNQSTPALTNDSAGVYHHDLTVDEPGKWYWRIQGTGAIVAATLDGEIHVADSRFPV
jgi:hypothetical protein